MLCAAFVLTAPWAAEARLRMLSTYKYGLKAGDFPAVTEPPAQPHNNNNKNETTLIDSKQSQMVTTYGQNHNNMT
eukprot:3140562-Amphidinium_carterae.1